MPEVDIPGRRRVARMSGESDRQTTSPGRKVQQLHQQRIHPSIPFALELRNYSFLFGFLLCAPPNSEFIVSNIGMKHIHKYEAADDMMMMEINFFQLEEFRKRLVSYCGWREKEEKICMVVFARMSFASLCVPTFILCLLDTNIESPSFLL